MNGESAFSIVSTFLKFELDVSMLLLIVLTVLSYELNVSMLLPFLSPFDMIRDASASDLIIVRSLSPNTSNKASICLFFVYASSFKCFISNFKLSTNICHGCALLSGSLSSTLICTSVEISSGICTFLT